MSLILDAKVTLIFIAVGIAVWSVVVYFCLFRCKHDWTPLPPGEWCVKCGNTRGKSP